VCEHCQADARFVSRRGKRIISLLGELPLKRAYYHCRSCGRGHVPLDQEVGLNSSHLTPAASEVTCLAGVQTSFAQGSETTLRKMCGLRLCESTVERTTESAGERLRALLAAGETFAKLPGESEPWHWERDARGHTCAYVGLDATGIRQQGAGAAKADGRMAYVGLIYNPRGASWTRERRRQSQPHQVRYLAGFYDLDALGWELRRQAAQTGWDDAQQQIALSDGGAGLEDFFRKNFPLAVVILDFWHAKEHLVELGKALFGEGSDVLLGINGQTWLAERCHQLKQEGGAAVVQTLEALDLTARSAAVRETRRCETNYFRNHQHKMDYPRYLAAGWQIGSGPVESACKTVVNARLCGSGMRWGSPGSDALCHLRALYLSEPTQWESFWREHPN
jgi:hypothetical protein